MNKITIKEAREKRNYTPEEIAKKLKISKETYQYYEEIPAYAPYKFLYRISKICKIKIDDLIIIEPLKKIREYRNFTTDEIAKKIKIKKEKYEEYEENIEEIPLEKLQEIVKVLEVNIDTITEAELT